MRFSRTTHSYPRVWIKLFIGLHNNWYKYYVKNQNLCTFSVEIKAEGAVSVLPQTVDKFSGAFPKSVLCRKNLKRRSAVLVFLSYDICIHIRYKRVGNANGTVGVLVIFQNGGNGSSHGKSRAV